MPRRSLAALAVLVGIAATAPAAGAATTMSVSSDGELSIVAAPGDARIHTTVTTRPDSNTVDVDIFDNGTEPRNIGSAIGCTMVHRASNRYQWVCSGVSRFRAVLPDANNAVSIIDDGNALPTTITGGAGDDNVSGGHSTDALSGGGGNDSLFGGDGTDTLRGGSGDDYLSGAAGVDTVYGGAGADVIEAWGTSQTLFVERVFGEDGNDKIRVSGPNVNVDCGANAHGFDSLTMANGSAPDHVNCEYVVSS